MITKPLTNGIEVIVAAAPGQDVTEGGEDVEEGPGDDHVEGQRRQEGDHDHPPAQACGGVGGE